MIPIRAEVHFIHYAWKRKRLQNNSKKKESGLMNTETKAINFATLKPVSAKKTFKPPGGSAILVGDSWEAYHETLVREVRDEAGITIPAEVVDKLSVVHEEIVQGDDTAPHHKRLYAIKLLPGQELRSGELTDTSRKSKSRFAVRVHSPHFCSAILFQLNRNEGKIFLACMEVTEEKFDAGPDWVYRETLGSLKLVDALEVFGRLTPFYQRGVQKWLQKIGDPVVKKCDAVRHVNIVASPPVTPGQSERR